MNEDITYDFIIITVTDKHGHAIDNFNKYAVAKQNLWDAVAKFELQVFINTK